jgi:hypothetical protein
MSFSIFPSADREDLLRHVGSVDQLCAATPMTFADGPARGMQAIEVRTGSGLAFQILPDRGMGIGEATLFGLPLAWCSALGPVAPQFYNPVGGGWLRSFSGGLLTSCGLTNVGAPTTVEGMAVGQHGTLSHIPARDVAIARGWEGQSYRIGVSGSMLDYAVLGPALEIRRSISITMGENRIRIHDDVTNIGSRPQPFLHLYHFNFGYPLISENARLDISPVAQISARNPAHAEEVKAWRSLAAPQPDYQERVFYHDFSASEAEMAHVRLENATGAGQLVMEMKFPLAALDHLVEWKMFGEREYVLGLEPGNCFASGRDACLAENDIDMLEAEETKSFDVSLAFALVV